MLPRNGSNSFGEDEEANGRLYVDAVVFFFNDGAVAEPLGIFIDVNFV